MQSSLDQAIESRRFSPAQCPKDRFEGRGIVICAGGTRYFTCAWVLISVLRRVYQTTLPIQVWHLGRREMSEEMQILLAEEGVEVVDADAVLARYPARLVGGWPLKPYAIAHSRFREVLYLDADTIPLVDPQQAFGWETYRDNGLLLWPDIVDIKATNPIWGRLGLEPVDRISIDSGVLLADKIRAWDVLDLAIAMNEFSGELYRLIHGDKDTFLLSTMLLNRPFGLIPHRPFQFEWDMVQRDPAGDPFLHHRCGGKWLLTLPNRPLCAPAMMPACEAALAELRERWSGYVFHAPERSARALDEEARLKALRKVSVEAVGDPVRVLDLLPGSRVGAGRELEQHWAVIDRADALCLQFYRDQEPIATLAQRQGGIWHGLGWEPGSEIILKELAGDAVRVRPMHGDAPRRVDDLVAALVQPAWFAAGYDAELAAAIATALSLLNDAFDAVPEEIARWAASLPMPEAWRQAFEQLVQDLAMRRDRRMTMLPGDQNRRPRALDPGHYGRPQRQDRL
jgi:Mannosyltransferase putative